MGVQGSGTPGCETCCNPNCGSSSSCTMSSSLSCGTCKLASLRYDVTSTWAGAPTTLLLNQTCGLTNGATRSNCPVVPAAGAEQACWVEKSTNAVVFSYPSCNRG